jgi:hypothetical protein
VVKAQGRVVVCLAVGDVEVEAESRLAASEDQGATKTGRKTVLSREAIEDENHGRMRMRNTRTDDED